MKQSIDICIYLFDLLFRFYIFNIRMLDQEIVKMIAHLTELMNSPSRKEGSVLRIFHELFQLTHQGRDLPPLTIEWLSETACAFLSPELMKILFKLRLEIYSFQFAALNFIDIDDVIDDLTNGEILKSIYSLPPGAFNKFKRELLGSNQQISLNKSMMESSASTAPETKIINKEQPEGKENEDDSLHNALLKSLSSGNKGNIMESLKYLVNDEHFSIKSFGDKDLLKQSANLLLSTEVSELLEKLYIGEYSYLLVVNYILDLDAVKEDVSNGELLKSALPVGAFNNLKKELTLKMSSAPPSTDFQQLVGGILSLSLPIPIQDQGIVLPCITDSINCKVYLDLNYFLCSSFNHNNYNSSCAHVRLQEKLNCGHDCTAMGCECADNEFHSICDKRCRNILVCGHKYYNYFYYY